MFAPLITVVPAPVNVKLPAPENTPERVAVPELGFWIVLALETLKAAPELSLGKSTSVPPANTGLAPSEDKPTVAPLVMIVMVAPPEPEDDDDTGTVSNSDIAYIGCAPPALKSDNVIQVEFVCNDKPARTKAAPSG